MNNKIIIITVSAGIVACTTAQRLGHPARKGKVPPRTLQIINGDTLFVENEPGGTLFVEGIDNNDEQLFVPGIFTPADFDNVVDVIGGMSKSKMNNMMGSNAKKLQAITMSPKSRDDMQKKTMMMMMRRPQQQKMKAMKQSIMAPRGMNGGRKSMQRRKRRKWQKVPTKPSCKGRGCKKSNHQSWRSSECTKLQGSKCNMKVILKTKQHGMKMKTTRPCKEKHWCNKRRHQFQGRRKMSSRRRRKSKRRQSQRSKSRQRTRKKKRRRRRMKHRRAYRAQKKKGRKRRRRKREFRESRVYILVPISYFLPYIERYPRRYFPESHAFFERPFVENDYRFERNFYRGLRSRPFTRHGRTRGAYRYRDLW